MYLLHGALFGLVLSILIGPVFFTLIQTSIEHGFKKALLVAFGISLSDIAYILLAYLGLSKLIRDAGANDYIGYGGGAVLIIFSLVNFLKKPVLSNPGQPMVEQKGFYRYIFRGFIINGMSPFVLVFWLGAMSLAKVEYAYRGHEVLLFFTMTITIVFTTDCFKAFMATKLRSLITQRLLRIINGVVGLVLILFGLRMFFYEW